MADAFAGTPLQDLLKGWAVKRLVVGGYATEFCVDTTVRRASGLGFKITLLEDGHTTHNKAHLSAEKIREHHNLTLSMSPNVDLIASDDIRFV